MTRARTRGVALGTVAAALLNGCNTPDKVPAQPLAAQLPSPSNIAMEPRPAPKGQPREYLVGQSLPTAAQQEALDQPNQQPTLAKPTILNNPSSFNTLSRPATTRALPTPPPIKPLEAYPNTMVMPTSVAAPAPQAPPRGTEQPVLPPDVSIVPPPMPPLGSN